LSRQCSLNDKRTSSRRNLLTETTAVPKSATAFAKSFAQHQLDPNLVKSYATDYCGVKTLREAKRQQVEAFVVHLADWAEKDRNALLCQLNTYLPAKGNAA